MTKLKDTDIFGADSKTYDKSDIDKAKKKAKREKRNEIITQLYENTSLSQSDIGKLVDVRQQTVSQVVNRE
jgi:predicted XRE-type DNA-binding protein